jgi:Tol biopolymer transport system component
MNPEIVASDFFVAGGTLRPNTPSYVERPADEELFNLALAGEFCYVLTSRQMGKSSLMIRTARRLGDKGAHSAIIDLTKVGIDVNVEQWYLGLLAQLKRSFRLAIDLESWWQERASLGHVQRFADFLHDVLLNEIEGQIVIFMDEIDTTLNLAFSDDFFAAIRFVYNARATDTAYERLTFVLLGVATPADLIKDRNRTPFNIGQGIDLSDFSRSDSEVLKGGLKAAYPEQAETIFNRIFYWTNGHPYLTQKLCLSVAEVGSSDNNWSDEQVDALVEKLFLSKEARKETNLQFVRDYVANSPQRQRLLKIYRQVYAGKTISEDERSIDQNQLKLFGLVRVEDNVLKVRNEIYRRVFNLDWIKANTPVDWTRRMAIAAALLTFLMLAVLGFMTYQQSQQKIEEQARARITEFRNATDPNTRLTSLAGLFDLPEYRAQAKQLFYDELNTEERLELFTKTNPQTVGPQLITVVNGLYTDLQNNERDNALLAVMAGSLKQLNDSRATNLSVQIEQWLQGRKLFGEKEYEQAVGVYGAVINLNDRNPGAYFDRALAYIEVNESKAALADFETVLTLDQSRQELIRQIVANTPALYETALAGEKGYPLLFSLVPSPTSTYTPTPTPTSTPTPTETPSPTPSPTSTPTPHPATPTPTATPQPIIVAATEPPPALPTHTLTPTVTPKPTPRPATVIYVQSNGQIHSLGIVSSEGELINADLHRWAGAPTWSPGGETVAFYGEQGISELGGDYAKGSGIWTVGVQSNNVRLIHQIDHIRNMSWSPDGSKLAVEVGPPGVTHEIYLIQAADGQEISRFPGEQPAWSPNSQELVIKSCLPECGLWQVGLDGSAKTLLTHDSTDSYPTWSPAGDYLVFASRSRHGDWEIYRLDLTAGGEPERLTNRSGTDTTPVFSPDGLEIYFRTDAFGPWRVMAMAVDGGNERLVRDNVGQSEEWGLARPAVR